MLQFCDFKFNLRRYTVASETDLTIGGIDDIQKLHIRSVPLGRGLYSSTFQLNLSRF